MVTNIRWGADKFLARAGRKQATATSFGIYSTYCPRNSIHFLAHCYNFCKSLKQFRQLSSNQVSVAAMTSASDEKWRSFNIFQSREQLALRRSQSRRIRWMIKTLEAQVGQFLLGCKCLVSRGTVVQEQDPPWRTSRDVFPSKVLQLHKQRWVILRFDSLDVWKIINGGCRLDHKKWRRELFQRIFVLGIFGARWAAMPEHTS